MKFNFGIGSIWRLRHGYIAKITSFNPTNNRWFGKILDKDGKELANVTWDEEGNYPLGITSYDLLERKRGEEKFE